MTKNNKKKFNNNVFWNMKMNSINEKKNEKEINDDSFKSKNEIK